MLDIVGNRIYLTRGDSALIDLKIVDEAGLPYEYVPGDKIYFRMKENAFTNVLLLVKEIDAETLTLELKPEDTSSLGFFPYRYEVELVTAQGYRFTVIENAEIVIGVELGSRE